MSHTKNNELIAEFIKAEVRHGEYDLFGCTTMNSVFEADEADDAKAKHFYHPSEMLFNKSWDWLIPIIVHIEMIMEGVPNELLNVNFYSSFNEVYLAVIEFINYYNKNYI